MSKIKLSELVEYIGDDNITVQRVDNYIELKDNKKLKNTEITFVTNEVTTDQLVRGTQKKHGLIIWLPMDRVLQYMEVTRNDP